MLIKNYALTYTKLLSKRFLYLFFMFSSVVTASFEMDCSSIQYDENEYKIAMFFKLEMV